MKTPPGQSKILVCQLHERVEIAKPSGCTVVESPVSCLNAATTTTYRLTILCFSVRWIRARPGIIELCAYLKHNPLTRKVPLFVSVDRWHRGLVERMKEAGVDFVDLQRVQDQIDPERIFAQILKTGFSLHIDKILSRLCPFLRYEPIDSRRELIVCGAWQNRMVLGGKRLNEVCETEGHRLCEYFINPRETS